jgi:hypothetical protein
MRRVSYKDRREFAAELLKSAFFGAFYTAIGVRKNEEALTRAKLGSRMGREKTGISKLLSGPRNWQLDTISDFTEALDLRLEFSLVDRHYPNRRFTATGVQYDALSSFAIDSPLTINPGNMLTTQQGALSDHLGPSLDWRSLNYNNPFPETRRIEPSKINALPSPIVPNTPPPMRKRMIPNVA